MTQALYRKWRPKKWDEVISQEHVVKTLQNAIKSGKVGHAYLFSGPRGTGKTTTARLLAKAVNCLASDASDRPCDECANCTAVNDNRFMDLIEIDAASNTSVDDVRDLRDKINFSPSVGKYKVYIIDEVHMLSTAAFNALLKTLEEPPAHVIFILATTEVHKIPATVLSRCQRHEFRRIPVKEINSALVKLCHNEEIDADEDALLLISRQATGAMRDAISLLDQLASTGEKITMDLAQQVLGTATNQVVLELVEAIIKKEMSVGLDTIHKALDAGSDPRQFARQVTEYLRGLLLVKMGNDKQIEATKEGRQAMRLHSESMSIQDLMEWIGNFNIAINDLRTAWQPGLALELAMAKCITSNDQAVHPPVQVNKTPAQIEREEPVKPKPQVRDASSPPNDSPKVGVQEGEQKVNKTFLPPASGELTIDLVRANWNSIRAEVKKLSRPQTEALLNSQKSLLVRNGVLHIGFDGEVLRQKMSLAENTLAAQQAVKQVLGMDITIVCEVTGSKAVKSNSDIDVDPDGMVGTAMNLGGKLVHRKKEA